MWKRARRGTMHRQWESNTCTDAEGRGCWYEWWWVVSRDGSSMSVQCVLRVFKWVKSQLWLPDGGRFDPDHSDRPGLWCAAAYYWHYRETGIFLPNHFQLVLACTGWPHQGRVHVRKRVPMCECIFFSFFFFWVPCVAGHIHYMPVCVWPCRCILVSCKMSREICSFQTEACGMSAFVLRPHFNLILSDISS